MYNIQYVQHIVYCARILLINLYNASSPNSDIFNTYVELKCIHKHSTLKLKLNVDLTSNLDFLRQVFVLYLPI